VGHVVRTGNEMRKKFCSENLKERGHVEDLGVDGRTVLTSIWCRGF
jgi:hypothetical protein